ncbi:hypothetical protein RSOL_261440 [Rhizoctonia solani AG-3 Rhs1AP]|uniref:Uncharacterized protein n=2 Tax=Rhizoctonia solani AG-3 TaxID=1086053 RepID=A0A074SKH9_9AGAM|nr:hypothetical protein RSOL_261440 [Rhizoctonia solani AG-3 Rhs1AP]KEP50572.1 hypothetical protein V565_077470 [Rhizoctonia solani 123E]
MLNNLEEEAVCHSQDPPIFRAKQMIRSGPDDFRTLCRIMYPDPSDIGAFPHAEPGQANSWKSTILATSEFNMPSIRAYIVAQLAQNEAVVSEVPEVFLEWAMDLKEREAKRYQELMSKCYRAYAFRRRPPSYSDVKNVPIEAHNIMLVREHVRSIFIDRTVLRSWMSIPSPTSCTQPSICQDSLIEALVHNVANPSPGPDKFIFEPLNTNGMCGTCHVPDLLKPVKQKLNLEIDRYLEGLNFVYEDLPPSRAWLLQSRAR